MEFLGPRMSLRGDHSIPELSQVKHSFNMYRVVHTKSIHKAATFAYLEHLCRPLISMEDFMRIIKKFQPALKQRLMAAKMALNSGVNPFPALEKSITKKEVEEVALIDYTILVHAINHKRKEVFRTFKHRKSLLVNLISKTSSQILLYNEITTFIDGYDFLTGNVIFQNIPWELLEELDSYFYYRECKEDKFNLSSDCPTAHGSFLEAPDLESKHDVFKPPEDDEHPDEIDDEIFDLPACQCLENKECYIF